MKLGYDYNSIDVDGFLYIGVEVRFSCYRASTIDHMNQNANKIFHATFQSNLIDTHSYQDAKKLSKTDSTLPS